MRIVTYNLRGGGAGKLHWAKVLEDFDPDVFLVQESYEPSEHLPPLLHEGRHRHACWRAVEGLKWGSAVYVKGGCFEPLELPDFHGSLVGVKVDATEFPITAGRPLRVFSLHAPRQGSYQQAVQAMLDVIAQHRGDGDLLIGGDFNLTVGHRQTMEDLKTSHADAAILARIRDDFGLVSAWQTANPGLPLPQTLRWTRDKTTPYHCDGIFLPAHWPLAPGACRIISGDVWNDLSDHNPVVVDIG